MVRQLILANHVADSAPQSLLHAPGTHLDYGVLNDLADGHLGLLPIPIGFLPHTVVVDGADLTFSVHDDGAGIPRRYEVRVWDRFERGPNRLNASVPGSGIGLAIVRAIADAHGGTATYTTSDVLGGACFIVRLPGRVTSATHPGMATGAHTALRSTT